jgi:hypothetical protein
MRYVQRSPSVCVKERESTPFKEDKEKSYEVDCSPSKCLLKERESPVVREWKTNFTLLTSVF